MRQTLPNALQGSLYLSVELICFFKKGDVMNNNNNGNGNKNQQQGGQNQGGHQKPGHEQHHGGQNPNRPQQGGQNQGGQKAEKCGCCKNPQCKCNDCQGCK